MSRTKTEFLHEDTCIRVYNPEEQKLIAIYKSFAKAAGRLGITTSTLNHKLQSKRRVFSPTFKMEVAVRHGQLKPGDEELIAKTNKYQPL